MSESRKGLKAATGTYTDSWLTPPDLIQDLGPFGTDPCCPADMPWDTAALMLTESPDGGGLAAKWRGRVWLNPPYGNPMPWIQKFVQHGNGIALVSSRGTETKWAQLLLTHADLIALPHFRFKFCYPNGEQAAQSWGPSMLVAIGAANVKKLGRWAQANDILLFERV
jgi:hypothetical protein